MFEIAVPHLHLKRKHHVSCGLSENLMCHISEFGNALHIFTFTKQAVINERELILMKATSLV